MLVAVIGWMVGVSVVLVGVIGFIGLVIFYIFWLCGLIDYCVLFFGCVLVGVSVLLLVDIVVRLVLAVVELFIGVVIVMLGALVFIWLLLKVGC